MKYLYIFVALFIGYFFYVGSSSNKPNNVTYPTNSIYENNSEEPNNSDEVPFYPNTEENNNYESDFVDEPITSDNWECTDDCSGHEAGFQWADENGITDPSDCGGNSDSFIEGCEAYANEYQMQEDDFSEDDYDYNY